ncbi:MAG: terminase gpA endonuclease subunit, partial [Phycisphaerae bacterium]
DWEDAQTDDNKQKTFVNTVLGLTWKEKGDAPEWQNLYNRREPIPLNRPPKEVGFLTAGVDIQKDRIELEIVGWCQGKRSYSVDYRVLTGDTSSKEVWDQLAAVVGEQWEREDGVLMPLK